MTAPQSGHTLGAAIAAYVESFKARRSSPSSSRAVSSLLDYSCWTASKDVREIGEGDVAAMMKHLALVQFFTWLGLFCMWLHFSNAVPVVFGAPDKDSPLFQAGAEWAGVCYAVKDAVTFAAAFALMALARSADRRFIHATPPSPIATSSSVFCSSP